jgi:hypothetical protein
VRDQLGRPNGPGSYLFEEVANKTALRPADVTNRIVTPMFLVLGVVTAGAVRPREPQLKLFFVERPARDRKREVPHCHNDRAIACDASRELKGFARLPSGRQDYGVGSVSAARFADDLLELVAVGARGRTQTASQVSASSIDVDADATAPGRSYELGGKLAD